MAPKARKQAHTGAAPRRNRETEEKRAHEKELTRFRYKLSQSKRTVKREYNKLTQLQKKERRSKSAKTNNFDCGETFKSHGKSKEEVQTLKGRWLSADGIYQEEGWTEQNKDTPTGQRATTRATAVIDSCKEAGKKFVKQDAQHSGEMYRRLLEMDEDTLYPQRRSRPRCGRRPRLRMRQPRLRVL